jgi:hypothetical protein
MQLKLKENPREWQKFTAVLVVMASVLSSLAYRRGWLPREAWFGVLAALVAAIILSLLFPRWFRPLYRGGMTVSFGIGRVMGAILLTLFFVLVLTPIALLLRLTGKDLLRLKREPDATTFWQPAKCSKEFDRMF